MSSWKQTPRGEGILVAADEKLEWLLPWWWARYSAHNSLPVAFIDLGMSHFGKTFCEEKGEVIPLDMQLPFAKRPEETEKWETLFGKEVWENRKMWAKKPFAFLSTPFNKTLWLDLDCEVLQPLESLFELSGACYLVKDPDSSHERERGLGAIGEDEILYNTGVVLYAHGISLIEKWAEAILLEKEQFCSDQHVISKLIHTNQYPVETLHENYNWRMTQGLNINAVIIHWVGSWGKKYIRRYCGIAEEIAKMDFAMRQL